ncbi:hypothetical protein PENSPDRAFT_759960 [Peniophora sp. CONT]|nr:hypothetical protein PENSPDRAFT_759960 [Peniophora sp. CONT]
MTSTNSQPQQLALKDRIAALQAKPDGSSMHPSAAPARSNTTSISGQSTTPPRGTLRDKINKFERKGGVPIPRGSFGMNVPPEQPVGSNKSRELYGNRIPKPAPKPGAAPLQNSLRSVTAPSAFPRTGVADADGLPSMPSSPDMAPLSPDVTGDSAPSLGSHRHRRRLSVTEMVGQFEELDALKDVSTKTSRRSSMNMTSPISAIPSSLPVSPDAETSGLPTPPQSAAAETAPTTPTPPAEASETPTLKLGKLEPPPMRRAQSSGSALSNGPSTPGSDLHTAEILTGVRTTVTPTEVKPVEIPVAAAKKASPTASNATSPSSANKSIPPPIEVVSTAMVEPSLTPKPVKSKSYKVVVHRKTPETSTSTRNSIDASAEPRRQSLSSNSESHGHAPPHLRSKRQFKHLQQQPEPPSPAQNDLSDLLQDASWLEATLGSSSFEIPSVSFDSATPDLNFSLNTPTPTNVGRSRSMLIPNSPPHSTSQTSLARPSSAIDSGRTSASTPSLSIHGPSDNAPGSMSPKSARSTASTRRFFSMRKSRASMSSELSSDDSAPLATPPSPPDMFGRADASSMRSGFSVTSGGSSMRLSPRRGLGLMDRMLGRSGKTKSMYDDGAPTPIPEQPYQLPSLPSPVRENHLDISLSSADQSSFDLDTFPSVPLHSKYATEPSRR